MTPQEIFDTVARHLFAQGERAGIVVDYDPDEFDEGFACRYRAPGGTVCAVGKLIPDDTYDPEMEGCGVSLLLDSFGPRLPSWMLDNYELLDRLQMVHDQKSHWVDDKRMRWELSLAAQAYGLDDSILLGLSFNRPEGQDD
jgi:hypothetical protein